MPVANAPHEQIEVDFRGCPAHVHIRRSGAVGPDTPESSVVMLFIHGLSHWLFTWEDLFDAAARDAASLGFSGVLAFDLFGRGWSDRPEGVMDHEYFADQVDAVIGSLKIPPGVRFVVAGHSLGGAISLAWAARRPERCAGVFALAPAGLMPATIGLRAMRAPLLGSVIRGAFHHLLGRHMIMTGQDKDFAPNAEDRKARVARAQRSVAAAIAANPEVVPSVAACITQFPVDTMGGVMEGVICPVDLLYGDLDIFYGGSAKASLGVEKLYTEAMPHATIHRFEATGHAIHHERPTEIEAALVSFAKRAIAGEGAKRKPAAE